MIKLIDISEHNGLVDFEAVKDAGWGVIVRLGYGDDDYSQDDRYVQRNLDECDRLGIPYGTYIYSYATNIQQARSEARHALRLLNGRRPSLPCYFDSEEPGTEWAAAECANEFVNTIEQHGYDSGVYASLSWWLSYLPMDGSLGSTWVANWGTSSPGMDCDIWQYTSDEVGPGCNGRTDCNVCYIELDKKEGWEMNCDVKFGSVGTEVGTMQMLLNYRGGFCLAADGHAGEKTINALKAWQESQGLEVDGLCGEMTWRSLIGGE